MIRLQGVRLTHGARFEMQVPDLEVRAGEKIAIVGPSGVGKSTLLRALAGLHPCAAGDARVAGADLTTLSAAAARAHRAGLGLILQGPTLLPYLDLRANVLLPLRLAGAPLDRAAQARATDLLERAGLADRAGHRPDALSQGERQRAAICRALLTRPPLILADEPTAGLQSTLARAMVELMFEWMGARGTLLMVTHADALVSRFERVIDLGAEAA